MAERTRRSLIDAVTLWWRYFRYSRRARRNLLIGVGALLGFGVIWILVTGYLAAQELSKIESRLQTVRSLVASGQINEARAFARDIPAMTRHAERLTTGPAWWIASEVPYFGRPVEIARGATTAAAQLGGHAIPDLIEVIGSLNPSSLRVHGDTLRLQPLIAALPNLQGASKSVHKALADLAAVPRSSWFGPIDNRGEQFRSTLGVVSGYVDAAARAAQALPTMLGAHGKQTYFIGLQNESEMRGTGGLPGAFAIAETDNGTLKFTKFLSDKALMPAATHDIINTGLDFGSEYNSAYGASLPTLTYVDSNASPHFPYAAQIWAAMWKKVSGQQVDGVLAVDPTALSYFLGVTGPTKLPSGEVITSESVVSLTERDAYSLFPNNQERKDFLVAVLKASAHKLTSGAGSAVNLLHAVSSSSEQHRLMAWSRDPSIQTLIEQSDYAGAIPTGNRPFAGVIINNAAAGKLDYYLSRNITYLRTGCGSHRDVRVIIAFTNNAPATGLPPYVYTRLDTPPPGAKQGDTHVLLDYYATDGAQLQSITLNGKPVGAGVEHALGHPIYRLDVELPRGTTQTVTLHLDEPAGTGTPQLWQQPGVTPENFTYLNQGCS